MASNRPLSPHLQIWKWGPHMLVSILHRITGDGMALVGLFILVWWLAALASGANYYNQFLSLIGSPIGIFVLIGLSWAFFTHVMSGIRHFILHIGAGYELKNNRAWSILCPSLAIIATLGFWALIVSR